MLSNWRDGSFSCAIFTTLDVALCFQPLQNCIRLTLTQMPDLTQIRIDGAMQVVAVTSFFVEQAKQCHFRRERSNVMWFFVCHILTKQAVLFGQYIAK